MSKVLITRSKLDDLATAVSNKSGAALPLTIAQMQTAVQNIPTGGGGTLIEKSITANGTYDAEDDNADGYSSVTVAVPTPTPSLQSKSVSYTSGITQQTDSVTADSGYDGLGSVSVTVAPIPLTHYSLRPDAELIQTYTMDQMAVEDLGLTIPSYTTTAQSLKAAANLSPTIALDFTNYHYIVAERFLTIPEYSVTTKGKGRQEYTWCSYIYELTRAAANEFATIIDQTKKITSVQNFVASNQLYRLLYWSSSSAIALYATNAYGAYQTPSSPSVSGTTLTVKTPVLGVRGSTTYFTSTYMNALTDIRYQYVIEVYRAPNNLNYDGWEQDQTLQHMIDCIASTDHKLT